LKNTSTKHNKYVVNQKHEQVPVGSTGKDDSDLPKAVQVQIPSNVFLHSISEKSVLQLSKRYNRSWYKTPQNRFQIIQTCYQQAIVDEGKREITEHRFYAEIVTDITKRNSERKDT
jgi:hypothetical protein